MFSAPIHPLQRIGVRSILCGVRAIHIFNLYASLKSNILLCYFRSLVNGNCCMIVSNVCVFYVYHLVSFTTIPFTCKLKDVTSLPMIRPHCSDILNKRPKKIYISASVLPHGDPDSEFQLELEEIEFCGHIFTCYVGKYRILVMKL